MEDALEMIDRKISGLSIKRAPLHDSGGGANDSTVFMATKPKTSSTSSSDSASTSDSFNDNDIEVAPPGYNFFDESVIPVPSSHVESGPHRELPVDVPDSFVGTIKQTPRYPQLLPQMPSISTFKPVPMRQQQQEAVRGLNDPFSLHDDEGPGSDSCIIDTNATNTVFKNMQPQPQTPSTSLAKDKVFFVRYHLLSPPPPPTPYLTLSLAHYSHYTNTTLLLIILYVSLSYVEQHLCLSI